MPFNNEAFSIYLATVGFSRELVIVLTSLLPEVSYLISPLNLSGKDKCSPGKRVISLRPEQPLDKGITYGWTRKCYATSRGKEHTKQ